ncbi:cytochrome c, partial [Striga asiatica]
AETREWRTGRGPNTAFTVRPDEEQNRNYAGHVTAAKGTLPLLILLRLSPFRRISFVFLQRPNPLIRFSLRLQLPNSSMASFDETPPGDFKSVDEGAGHKQGANSDDLFGRQSGNTTTTGYSYSAATKNKTMNWEEPTLHDCLLNHKKDSMAAEDLTADFSDYSSVDLDSSELSVTNKRKYAEDEDEDEDEPESLGVSFYFQPLNPHAFDVFYETPGMDILSAKVFKSLPELKEMVLDIRKRLNGVLNGEVDVQAFEAKVKELFSRPNFLVAVDESILESEFLVVPLEEYVTTKDAQDRMVDVKQDPSFEPFLGWTEPLDVIRGTLCILFGYWNDKEFDRILTETRQKSRRLRLAAQERDWTHIDMITDIHYPANLNGLKQALAYKYGEESYFYKTAVKTIEGNKAYFEKKVTPSIHLLGSAAKGHEIDCMLVKWCVDDIFYLSDIGIRVIF